MQTATKELTYVKNFHEGRADMFLYKGIGGAEGINGQEFADQMAALVNDFHVQQINVRINSPGGSVMDGISIFNAIRNSKAVVHTYNDGVAASIAGIILQAGHKRFMNDFGRVMIHLPQAPAGTNPVVIENFRDMLVTILQNSTQLGEDEILEIMQAETWFTATEAISAGLVDQVINTNRLLTLANNELNDAAYIYNACNDLLETKTEIKMLKITNALKLQEGANEETVLNAVEEIQNTVETLTQEKETATGEVETLKSENEALKSEIETLKTANKEIADKAALEFVENAISEGKLDEAKRETLTEAAKIDFEGFKNTVNAMVTPHADITSVINTASGEEPTKGLREMEKTEPAKVENIRNENPDLYAKMYFEEYGQKLN